MRKSIRTFIVAVCLVIATGASATDYKYLIFESQDGTNISIALDGLTITFNNGILTATQGGSSKQLTVSDLSKMFFSTLDGIRPIENENTAVSLQGATLSIKAPAGTQARVFDASGKLVMSTRITTNGTPANIGLLKQGVYVVKAGQLTHKILVK